MSASISCAIPRSSRTSSPGKQEMPGQSLAIPQSGVRYAPDQVVPKIIYRADGTRRGFITSMLAPVNCRQEPQFGMLQTLVVMTLAVGTMTLMRFLLAH